MGSLPPEVALAEDTSLNCDDIGGDVGQFRHENQLAYGR
jgi:hypothetical protein